MNCFVTGSEGFIGKHLVERLRADGHTVVGWDIKRGGDILDYRSLTQAMKGSDIVFHLAAKADVRHSHQIPTMHLITNTEGTVSVLNAMKTNGVKRIVFASTASVYGNQQVYPTPEVMLLSPQTSMYSASKLAAETFIEAYCEAYDFTAFTLRLTGVLGEGYQHGHVIDFYRQLCEHPDYLKVLGNGQQRKSYVYVKDVVNAMVMLSVLESQGVNRVNVGLPAYITVRDSARAIADRLGLSPRIDAGNEDKGWVGDNPFIYLDCTCLNALGWQPTLGIYDSLDRTVDYLKEHHSEITRP